jgi:hypothetical protein
VAEVSEPAYITVVETRPFIEDASRIPLFLLTAYSKSRQTDLTPARRAAMRRVVAAIVT